MTNSLLAFGALFHTRQAGLLAPGSSSRRAFPGSLRRGELPVACFGVRPRSQRRARAGFPPASRHL